MRYDVEATIIMNESTGNLAVANPTVPLHTHSSSSHTHISLGACGRSFTSTACEIEFAHGRTGCDWKRAEKKAGALVVWAHRVHQPCPRDEARASGGRSAVCEWSRTSRDAEVAVGVRTKLGCALGLGPSCSGVNRKERDSKHSEA